LSLKYELCGDEMSVSVKSNSTFMKFIIHVKDENMRYRFKIIDHKIEELRKISAAIRERTTYKYSFDNHYPHFNIIYVHYDRITFSTYCDKTKNSTDTSFNSSLLKGAINEIISKIELNRE
jgi:hypothetical protein